MSGKKRKAPDSEEQVCMLCRRGRVDTDICGHGYAESGLLVHHFCLFFADGLLQQRTPLEGIIGFPLSAISHAIKQADQKQCFVCGQRGAAITCAETGCERSFHLPCAVDGECVTQYFGRHSSFCWEHRPQQAAEAAPAETNCVICLEPVGDSTSYHTMVCPECRQAWFHRGCIQGQAMHAGFQLFRCPVCGKRASFCSQMSTMGIRTPRRRHSWWEDAIDPSLQESLQSCNASQCFCDGGRDVAEEMGCWELLVCTSCAAQGIHRLCSFLPDYIDSWECNICAGAGTASSSNWELAGPSTARQAGLRPAPTSALLEKCSSGPASQAAAGPSHSSPRPELSSQPREPEAKKRTTRQRSHQAAGSSRQRRGRRGSSRRAAPRTQGRTRSSARRATSRSSRSSPQPKGRRRSRQRGRACTRSRSPRGRQASSSQSRARGRRGSCSGQRGAARARSRSRAQRRRRTPQSRSQRSRGSSRRPAARAGSRSKRPMK